MPAILPDIFLFFITDESGLFYYVDQNGLVQRRATPTRLRHFPREWLEVESKWGRSSTYFGLDRTYTNSYAFYKDAAKIVRNRFYQQRGVEERMNQIIAKRNNDNVYELWAKGGLEFPEMEDEVTKAFTVNMIDTGVAETIKNTANNEYDIPCNSMVAEAIRVRYDGVQLFDTFNYGVVELNNFANIQTVALAYLNNEGDNVGIQYGASVSPESIASFSDIFDYVQESNNFIIKSTINTISVTAAGSMSVTITGAGPTPGGATLSVLGAISSYDTNVQIPQVNTIGIIPVVDGTYDIPINFIGELEKTEKFFMIMQYQGSGTISYKVNETRLKFGLVTKNPESEAYALRPIDLGNKLLEKMAPGKGYKIESTILEQYRHVVVLSGDDIRGFPDAAIPTKWSDYWQFIWKLTGSALTIRQVDQRVIIERRTYVFDKTKTLTNLGAAKSLKIRPASDMFYNRVKVGYKDQEYDQRNGRFEFNSTQYYNLPITKYDRELDLIIPYRADCYGQEFLRQDYFLKETTDAREDNEVFIVDIQDQPNVNGSYDLFRDVTIDSGVPTVTVFNVRISPRRILNQHLDLIGGALFNLHGEYIAFSRGDKNTALVTTIGGVTVYENTGIPVDSLPPSYYRPLLLEIETQVSGSLSRIMSDGLGEMVANFNGTTFSGFPWEVSSKPALNEAQTFKLLCSANVDVRIFEKINDSFVDLEGMGIISHKIPVKPLPDDPIIIPRYNSWSMDQRLFKYRIDRYSNRKNYYQKWQTNDRIDLQFITRSAQVVLKVYNCKGQVVKTPVVNQVVNPAITNPNILLQASITLDDLTPGKYYLYMIFGVGDGAKAFLCEGWHIKTKWRGTFLIEYTNSYNNPDVIWNAPFASSIRVEGMLRSFRPGNTRTSYTDRNGNATTIEGIAYREYTLAFGSFEDGLPDWMIDKLNAILLLDDVRVDGLGVAMTEDAEITEILETQGQPLKYMTVEVRQTDNEPGIYVDADGIEDSGLTVEYDLNTIGITSPYDPNANQQDAIVKILDIK